MRATQLRLPPTVEPVFKDNSKVSFQNGHSVNTEASMFFIKPIYITLCT